MGCMREMADALWHTCYSRFEWCSMFVVIHNVAPLFKPEQTYRTKYTN